MRFSLSKWYLDCVSDAGEAVILYWARLRWGALRLDYGAALSHTTSGDSHHRHTLRPGPEPEPAADGTLEWRCSRLRADGVWRRSADGIARTLLDDSDGRIDWHCLCPRADATLRLDGHTVSGLGYVEHLTMTAGPAPLPFNELRWGRFLSPSDVLVWIEWRGRLSRSWLFANGAADDRPAITARSVSTSDGALRLRVGDGQVLRSGRLASALPCWIRPLAAVLPVGRNAAEEKRVARGSVRGPRGSSSGWVIHEVVRWS
jgi:hypothetical protein